MSEASVGSLYGAGDSEREMRSLQAEEVRLMREEIERMRPVVEAAEAWAREIWLRRGEDALRLAVETYQTKAAANPSIVMRIDR